MITYLPRPDQYDKYIYIDIETDSLNPTKIWCLSASWMHSDDIHLFVGHEAIRRFFDELRGKEVYFVGHNAISFDGPVTARLTGGFADASNIVDSLVLSYLYDPALLGGHNLEVWGERVGEPKGIFNDWSHYSEEMGTYNKQDVKTGKKVIKALWSRMKRMGYSETSCRIEHQIRSVIDRQEKAGWMFDIPGAQALYSQILADRDALEGPIRELFPKRLEAVNTYVRRKLKDGSDHATYLRHVQQYPEITYHDEEYTTWDYSEFNIGSPQQRVTRLLELGWKPQSFTPKGFPQVNEESLLAYAEESGQPAMKAIAEWLVMTGRSSMIDTWLNNVDYDDSCMHGRIFTCGAATRRMTHSSPNTANIPKAKAKVRYGIECRKLWRARPGRKEIGFDAKGLEMRTFAHYLNDEAMSKLFIEGDPHLNNTRLLELPDEMRDLTVKNGFYAWLYGAYDPKLGTTIKPELSGDAAKEYGAWARARLESGITGLKQLISQIKGEGELIRTIDGGFIHCNSSHAALNYKLQSAGAILMKEAVIIAQEQIDRKGLDAFFVGNIHDEGQLDGAPADADEAGLVCCQSVRDAGESLNFRVAMDAAYKVGDNWSDTH